MGKEKNFGKNINTAGFNVNKENINRNGRPLSMKRQLQKIAINEGELPIPKSQIIKETDDQIIVKIPTLYAMALRLVNMAMSKGSNSFNALKLILETFDGKATQSIETKFVDTKPEIIVMDQKTKDAINDLM